MKPVTVGRYDPTTIVPHGDPVSSDILHQIIEVDEAHTWNGWVETEDWIVYERDDGLLYAYNGRSKSGAVTAPAVVVERAT